MFIVMSTFVYSPFCIASDYEQTYGVASTIDYDSNPTLSSKNKQSLFRYNLTPTYSFSKIDEVQHLIIDAALNLQRSSNSQISSDRKDPTFNVAWLYSGERNTYDAIFNYAKSSTRFSELTESGAIQRDGSALNKSLSVGWGRSISEVLNSKINASISDSTFSGANLNSYQSKSVSANLNYAYSLYASPFVQASFSDYKTQLTPTRNSSSYIIGSTFLLSDRLSWNFNTGLNISSSSGTGFIGKLGANYQNEYSTLSVVIDRAVSATGLNDSQKSDSFNLAYNYTLNDLSSIGAAVSFRNTQSIFASKIRTLDGYYSKKINPNWDMRVTLSDRDYVTNTDSAHGNIIGFSLIYKYPSF